MALVLKKEDGSGMADANSYAAVADGDTYYEGHLYGSDWTVANPATRAAALVMATRLIDSFFWFRGSKGRAEQALQWPREGVIDLDSGQAVGGGLVPAVVVQSAIETARFLIKADRTADPEGQGTMTVTEFATKSTTYDASTRRPVIPAVVQVMLARLGEYVEKPRNGGAISLVRV